MNKAASSGAPTLLPRSISSIDGTEPLGSSRGALRPTPEDWRVWSELVRELALRHAPNLDTAEEVHQTVMLLLCRRWRDVRNLRAWAVVVVRNLLTKHYRSSAHRLEVATSKQEPGVFPEDETRILVAQTLEKLSRGHRRVLGLHLVGLTHAEIAERLGVPVNQVGPRLARAQRAARRARDGRSSRCPACSRPAQGVPRISFPPE